MDPNLPDNGPSPTARYQFGTIEPTPAIDALRHALNQEIVALLRSLPRSTHADAAVFCMQHLGTAFLKAFDFFDHYHAPAWSVLHWIVCQDTRPSRSTDSCACARTAHAMALFLHPLDDHLNDGQLPATHLNVLLRSQAWRRMHAALKPLADGVAGGETIVRDFIDDYYASIGTPPARATLDGYCAHFRRQMATWLIVPVLMARRQAPGKAYTDALRDAYESFGIAWRLIDDLQDIEPDRQSGTPSAVYYSLPEDLRPEWTRAGPKGAGPRGDRVAGYLATHAVPDTIAARIHEELTSAAAAATGLGMAGLAVELRALGRPFQDRTGPP
jgi:hypothetical protein